MRLELQGASGSVAQTIATAAGGILAKPSKDIAENIVKMQANYLDSGQVAPLLAACVSTLDHREEGASPTPFGEICRDIVMPNIAKQMDPDKVLVLSKADAALQQKKNVTELLKILKSSRLVHNDRCIGKPELTPKEQKYCEFLRAQVEVLSEALSGQKQGSLILPSQPALAEAEGPAAGRRDIAASQLPWVAAAPRSNPPSLTQ